MCGRSCFAVLDESIKSCFQIIHKHRIRPFDGCGSANNDKVVALAGMAGRNLIHCGA